MHIFLQQKIKFWLVIFSNSIQKLGKGPKVFNKNLGFGLLQNL